MSGIAGIVHWDRRPVGEGALRAMLELVAHRGPDGLTWEVDQEIGLGAARLALTQRELSETQPVWSPDRSLAAVADARIYNRQEVLSALGGSSWPGPDASDAELILAAYTRWGVEVCDHLSGDYAFVVWDGGRRRIHAARDPFGVKPLFYRVSGGTFAFGSEARQLLVGMEGPVEPEPTVVGELLLAAPRAGRATAIRGIERLVAGRYLLVTEAGVRQVPHWPPAACLEPDRAVAEGYSERFYDLFRRAVERRLASDRPVGMELSGGHDSSAIAVTAGELAVSGQVVLPDLLSVSHIYPGLACDESAYIAAVVDSVPFAHRQIDCSDLGPVGSLAAQHWHESAPDADLAPARTELVGRALAAAGSRVLLTGFGGDELVSEPEWIPDLLRTGRWLSADRRARELSRRVPEERRLAILGRAARSAVGPRGRRLYRRLVPPRRRPAPGWIDEDLRATLAAAAVPRERADLKFRSRSQEEIHQWLTSAVVRWGLERAELRSAYQGVELRHPFFDRELAEFVLSIPWHARVGEAGAVKPLLVESLGKRLPNAVRERRSRVVFNSFFEALMAGSLKEVQASLARSGRWASIGYTRREAVLGQVRSWRSGDGRPWQSTLELWGAVNLEIWLRRLGSWEGLIGDLQSGRDD